MAGMYIGVSNVARKVKNQYIGVGSVARKIKNGFIGVSSVARKFFSSLEYTTYSTGTWSSKSVSESGGLVITGTGAGLSSRFGVVFDASQFGLTKFDSTVSITYTLSRTLSSSYEYAAVSFGNDDDPDLYGHKNFANTASSASGTYTATHTANTGASNKLMISIYHNRSTSGTVTLTITSLKVDGVEYL